MAQLLETFLSFLLFFTFLLLHLQLVKNSSRCIGRVSASKHQILWVWRVLLEFKAPMNFEDIYIFAELGGFQECRYGESKKKLSEGIFRIYMDLLPETNIAPENGWLEY